MLPPEHRTPSMCTGWEKKLGHSLQSTLWLPKVTNHRKAEGPKGPKAAYSDTNECRYFREYSVTPKCRILASDVTKRIGKSSVPALRAWYAKPFPSVFHCLSGPPLQQRRMWIVPFCLIEEDNLSCYFLFVVETTCSYCLFTDFQHFKEMDPSNRNNGMESLYSNKQMCARERSLSPSGHFLWPK